MGSPVIWFGTKGKVLASGGLVDVNGLPIGGSLPVSNKNTAFTAVAGNSYLVDTSSTAITVTLPAGAAHATMRFYDAAGNWSTNNIILTPATGEKFRGLVANDTLVGDVNAAWIELVWDVTNSQWQYATNGFSIGSGGGSSSAGGLVPTYKSAAFTAATNFNYLVNTTSAGITATLPAGATGATIRFTDDAGTWKQNNLTITPATGEKFQGQTANDTLVCDLANGWVELNWDATNSQWTVSSNGVAASTYTGPIVTDWAAFTLVTQGFGTTVNNIAWYRRVGDTMELSGRFDSGTVTAAEARLYLPSGLTAVSTTNGPQDNTIKGKWWRSTNATSTRKGGTLWLNPVSAAGGYLLYGSDDYTTGAYPTGASLGNSVAASTESQFFHVTGIQISQWQSQNNIAYQNDVEYAYNSAAFANGTDSTSFAYGKVGQAMATITTSCVRRVRFTSSIQDGDRIKLQVQGVNAGSTWLDADALGMNLIQQGSFAYGHQINGVTGSTTDVDIYFYQYAQCTGSTYGSAGTNWNSNWKWRLVKSSGGQVVGFGIVVPGTSAGLVSANGVPGNTTGSAIASGYVGEVITASRLRSSALGVTTSVEATVAGPITLTPGVWVMYAMVGFTPAATTNITRYDAAISKTNNTLPAVGTIGVPTAGEYRQFQYQAAQVNGNDVAITCAPVVVTVSTSTPYYLVGMSIFTVSTQSAYGSITAVRIA